MKIPYRKEVAHCYQRVKGVPVLEPGVGALITEAKHSTPFSLRLQKVMDQWGTTIEQFRRLDRGPKSGPEEDLYICCAFDVLESMFEDELQTIRKHVLSKEEKQKELEALIQALDKLQLGPKWNEGYKPEIRKRIEGIRRSLD